MSSLSLRALTSRYAVDGAVRWIGVRPDRRAPMLEMDQVQITETGLEGDRRSSPGKRAVTLIQWEHLPVIAALAGGQTAVSPDLLRRNIAVSGLNLLAVRNRLFRVGTAVLKGTGLCAPCSRMEEALGEGGYNAVRGHGGITAEVVESGSVAIGDAVTAIVSEEAET